MKWLRENWIACLATIVVLVLIVLYGMADSGYSYNGYRYGP